MTTEEIRARSSEKVQQVISLMKTLNITVEARERISQEGFIEKTIFWLDNENYPVAPEVAPETAEAAPETAVEEAV